MQHTLNPLRSPNFTNHSPAFNVVIAYEDFETGKHAKQTYDFLIENLGPDCDFQNQMWKFDILNIPKLRELATQDAKAADVIIIASHGDRLPLEVKAWIESWAEEVTRPLALVALFDQPATAAVEQTKLYLATVARRAHMEFFSYPDSSLTRTIDPAPASSKGIARTDAGPLAALGDVLHSSTYDTTIPRWGINE